MTEPNTPREKISPMRNELYAVIGLVTGIKHGDYIGRLPTDERRLLDDSLDFITKASREAINLAAWVNEAIESGQKDIAPYLYKFAHDMRNNLSVILGRAQLFSRRQNYRAVFGHEGYEKFTDSLSRIEGLAHGIRQALSAMDGAYKSEGRVATLVDADKLIYGKTTCTIVHIDDSEDAREQLRFVLGQYSNIVPDKAGFFGHLGKEVNYTSKSFGSVREALWEIPYLGNIDLLVTDREMPVHSGFDLLDFLKRANDEASGTQDYRKIRSTAMLTAGNVTEEEAERVKGFGAALIDKESKPLDLEERIFRAMKLT